MKRLIFKLIIVILTFGLVIGGYTTPLQVETWAASEVIRLKFAHNIPPYQPGKPFSLEAALDNYPGKIKELTNGKVIITNFPSESLLGTKELFDGVVAGATEISRLEIHGFPNDLPLFSVFHQPGIRWTTPQIRFRVIMQMIERFPQLAAELKGLQILAVEDLAASALHFRVDKYIRVPADMRGMKIATGEVDLVKSWGATPVSVTWTERYLAMERGVIDATLWPWGTNRATNLHEVTKSHTDGFGMGQRLCLIVMNGKIWNTLPADIQKVFTDLTEWFTLEIARGYRMGDEEAKAVVAAMNHKVHTVTQQDFPQWAVHYQPIIDDWLTKTESKGLPARQVYTEVLRLVDKYSD